MIEEPTVVNTVTTGWPSPGDRRPAAMFVFVLTSTDGDGDGHACWQQPGEEHEYSWAEVFARTRHNQRIVRPPVRSLTSDGVSGRLS